MSKRGRGALVPCRGRALLQYAAGGTGMFATEREREENRDTSNDKHTRQASNPKLPAVFACAGIPGGKGVRGEGW